jgi:hypothetical protein
MLQVSDLAVFQVLESGAAAARAGRHIEAVALLAPLGLGAQENPRCGWSFANKRWA